MNIGRFSVSNPVLVNILMVAILLLGTLSLLRLPREMISEIAFSWVFIAVPYPGVSAEEIEKNLTIPIEESVTKVDRIKKINSESREGLCFVSVQFEDGISKSEFDRLYQAVRTEFDNVALPEGTLDPWIDDFTTSDFVAVITINITGSADQRALMNETAEDLREKLLDVKDVSKVEIVGGQEREIWIEAQRNKLEAFGVSLDEVVHNGLDDVGCD